MDAGDTGCKLVNVRGNGGLRGDGQGLAGQGSHARAAPHSCGLSSPETYTAFASVTLQLHRYTAAGCRPTRGMWREVRCSCAPASYLAACSE